MEVPAKEVRIRINPTSADIRIEINGGVGLKLLRNSTATSGQPEALDSSNCGLRSLSQTCYGSWFWLTCFLAAVWETGGPVVQALPVGRVPCYLGAAPMLYGRASGSRNVMYDMGLFEHMLRVILLRLPWFTRERKVQKGSRAEHQNPEFGAPARTAAQPRQNPEP